MTSLAACAGGAGFTASTTIDFTQPALPTALKSSDYFVQADTGAPLNHRFTPSNVQIKDSYLQLIVPGAQSGPNITGGEISTSFHMKYASVCTYAILVDTPGVCNGMFMYKNDSQETDIEWLSDPKSGSNVASPLLNNQTFTSENNTQRFLQFTNQALNGNRSQSTISYARAPSDATSKVHEYRLDWKQEGTKYFVDGVQVGENKVNVPSVAARWYWNNWVNGDPNWTGKDVPKQDAVFKIQKIVMYYNSTGNATLDAPRNGGNNTQSSPSTSGASRGLSTLLGGLGLGAAVAALL